jgi:hypothetical protein
LISIALEIASGSVRVAFLQLVWLLLNQYNTILIKIPVVDDSRVHNGITTDDFRNQPFAIIVHMVSFCKNGHFIEVEGAA